MVPKIAIVTLLSLHTKKAIHKYGLSDLIHEAEKVVKILSGVPDEIEIYLQPEDLYSVTPSAIAGIPIGKKADRFPALGQGIELLECYEDRERYYCYIYSFDSPSLYSWDVAEDFAPDVSVGSVYLEGLEREDFPFEAVKGAYLSSDRVLDTCSRYFSYIVKDNQKRLIRPPVEEKIIGEKATAEVIKKVSISSPGIDIETRQKIEKELMEVMNEAILAGKIAKKILNTPDRTDELLPEIDFSLGFCRTLFDSKPCFEALSRELYTKIPKEMRDGAVQHEENRYGAFKLKDGICAFYLYSVAHSAPRLDIYCVIKSLENIPS